MSFDTHHGRCRYQNWEQCLTKSYKMIIGEIFPAHCPYILNMIHYSFLLLPYSPTYLTNHMPEMCIGTNMHILCHTRIELVSILWVVKKLALLSHCDTCIYKATTYVLKH